MLVQLVVADLKDLKVLTYLWQNNDRKIKRLEGLLEAGGIDSDPVVDAVFHITNTVDVAQDFERVSALLVWHALDLLLTTIVSEIAKRLMNNGECRLGPLERGNVYKSCQIVDAEADLDFVARCHLDLVLCITSHTVGQMLPGGALHVSITDYVESISVRVALRLLLIWPENG